MTIPPSVKAGVEGILEERFGSPTAVRSAGSVGGGCINPSARLETKDGDAFFLKWNEAASPEMFVAESDGLQALAAPGSLRIPEVAGWGGAGTREDPGWLLLEYVPRGSPGPGYGHRMGKGLARLHASTQEAVLFGWHRDNFIGSLPQANGEEQTWPAFWRERRLAPQFEMARSRGCFRGREGIDLERVLARLEEILPSRGGYGPSLLHGDLWSGNYYPDSLGEPVLIDPAVYRGDGEVDLAMMELFGSLPQGFREGYETVRRISPEYGAFKRDLYQLYYLLVHVNLFGAGYEGSSISAARRVLAAT